MKKQLPARLTLAAFALSVASLPLQGCAAQSASDGGVGQTGSATPAQGAAMPPEIAAMEAHFAAYRAMPDTPGTGAFPAMKQVDPRLPDHTVYRPADLAKVGKNGLAIVGWGNGGCANDGASDRLHLLEIASHGYIVVAPGAIKSGPGVAKQPTFEPGRALGADTTAQQVMQGIEWAIAENDRPESPYYQKLDPSRIAVSGYSCGGVQALSLASDPRVKAVVIHNSGLFPDGVNPIAGVTTSKSWLSRLHTPVVYIEGGKSDIAYGNGMDDFSRITHVPAMMLNLDVGHGGTFHQPNGGLAAMAAVNWLEWQLRGSAKAAKLFEGTDCVLCSDPRWTVERKNWPPQR